MELKESIEMLDVLWYSRPHLSKGYIKLVLELFCLDSTLNFGIPTVLVFQLEVYYKVDRLLTGLTAQQKGTTARWYSNKTSIIFYKFMLLLNKCALIVHWLFKTRYINAESA